MFSRPPSLASHGNPDLIIEPVTWTGDYPPRVSSSRSSINSQTTSNNVKDVGWSRPGSTRTVSRPSSAFSQRNPDLIIEGVGPVESAAISSMSKSNPRMRYPTSPKQSPRDMSESKPPPLPRSASEIASMPPTSWRPYPDLPPPFALHEQTPPPPQRHEKLQRKPVPQASSMKDPKQTGPSLQNQKADKRRPEEEDMFGSQSEDKKTLEALCRPTEDLPDSQSSTDEMASGFRNLFPTSPFFEDFDHIGFASLSLGESPLTAVTETDHDMLGDEAKKTVQFDPPSSFRPVNAEIDKDIPSLKLSDDSSIGREVIFTPNSERHSIDEGQSFIQSNIGKSSNAPEDEARNSRYPRTKEALQVLIDTAAAIEKEKTARSDARNSLPSQRRASLPKSETPPFLSDDQSSLEDVRPELPRIQSSPYFSAQIRSRSSSQEGPSQQSALNEISHSPVQDVHSERPVFNAIPRQTYQEVRLAQYAPSAFPPMTLAARRALGTSTLARDSSSSSLNALTQPEPSRHPLAFSQVPSPSPSPKLPTSATLSKLSEEIPPMPEKKARKKLQKRRHSTANDSPIQQDENIEEPLPSKEKKATPPQKSDVREKQVVSPAGSSLSNTSTGTNVRETQVVSPAFSSFSNTTTGTNEHSGTTTTQDTNASSEIKMDPKFKQFTAAVVNYYKPAPSNRTDSASSSETSATADKPGKPRRKSFRASSFFGHSHRLSAVPEGEASIAASGRNSMSSRQSVQIDSSGRESMSSRQSGKIDSTSVSPLPRSPFASRDSSPNRSSIRTESPTIPALHNSPHSSRQNSPTRPTVKIESISIPPIPVLPVDHRNNSPSRQKMTIEPISILKTPASALVVTEDYSQDKGVVSIADLLAYDSSGGEILVFRRFDGAHKRVLLDLQHSIVSLETQVQQLDDAIEQNSRSGQPGFAVKKSANESAQAEVQRHKLLDALKSALNEYDDLLLKFNALRLPPSDQRPAMNKFKLWLSKHNTVPADTPSTNPMTTTTSIRQPPQTSSSSSSLTSLSGSQIHQATKLPLQRASTVATTSASHVSHFAPPVKFDPKIQSAVEAIMAGSADSKKPKTRRMATR